MLRASDRLNVPWNLALLQGCGKDRAPGRLLQSVALSTEESKARPTRLAIRLFL